MPACKSKNCKFYEELREYNESLKLTEYTDYALSAPDPCTCCKRWYPDGYIPKNKPDSGTTRPGRGDDDEIY